MRAFDPAQRIRELHQRARIEAWRGPGPIERRIVAQSKSGATHGSRLRIEQFSFELWKCRQGLLRGCGDIGLFRATHTATHVEWRPAEPTVALHSPPRLIQQRGGKSRRPRRRVHIGKSPDLAEISGWKIR